MPNTLMVAAVLLILPVALFGAPGAGRYRLAEERAAAPASPSLLVLRDHAEGLEAAVAPTEGGELTSFRVRLGDNWVETLYRARDYSPAPGWRGKAPLLWPATGRNLPTPVTPAGRPGDFAWDYQGRRFPIAIHCFAKDMAWTVRARRADESSARLTLELRDNPPSRRSFPFRFRLQAEYVLAAGALELNYVVTASPRNARPMPFSIGNHITFRAPLLPHSRAGDLLIETPSTIEYLKRPPGLPTGEQRPRSYARPIRLADIPRLTAISLGGYDGEPYLVLRDPAGRAIRLSHRATSCPPARRAVQPLGRSRSRLL